MKTNHYFKLATLLLLFAFFGCQKENVIKLEGSKDDNSIEQVNNYSIKPEFISGDEIPDIIENLASKTNKAYSKISDLNGKLNYNKARIFIKQALKVAKEGEKTNYSFDIFLDDMPELEFYSLIVGKSEEGIIDEPYIIGYTMTKEDYENYIAHDLDFKYFRATQRFYTFDSFFADTAKGMTGRSGDCGEYVVGSGGTSSGGTSSNTGGGVTEPGETFISTFDGAIVTSDFGLSQNANQSNYDYVVTINTSNGSSETTTTGYSATVTTAATNSSGYTTIQTSGINWINFTITYNDTNSSGGSSGNSGPCIKTSGSGDDIIWYWYDECPPSTQLKRGDTGRSTTSFSDCFVVSGGIAVNVTLLAVEVNTMLGSIELNDDELAFLTKNQDATLPIFKFLRTNNSFEDRVFVKLAVEDLKNGLSLENIDFEDKVINELSGPTKNIYDQLAYRTIATSSILQNIYLFFGNSYRDFNVTYKVDKMELSKNGSTKRDTVTNKDFTITINSEYIYNRAPIEIARTILHESIHAYTMMHQLSSSESFYEIFKAYLKIEKGKDIHHTIMAQEYIIPMANALKSFDNNQEDDILYNYLAWDGIPTILRDPSITDQMIQGAKDTFRARGLTTD